MGRPFWEKPPTGSPQVFSVCPIGSPGEGSDRPSNSSWPHPSGLNRSDCSSPAPTPRLSRAAVASAASTTVNTTDHHSEYLAKAVAALTPEGRKRVDELLDQLAIAGRSREWVVRFALAREAEVDAGRTDTSQADEPGERLNEQELDGLTAGFMTIRDQEPLDDVNDWANAVLALLADERA